MKIWKAVFIIQTDTSKARIRSRTGRDRTRVKRIPQKNRNGKDHIREHILGIRHEHGT